MTIPPVLMRFAMHGLQLVLPWACAGCRRSLGTVNDTGYCGPCWLSIRRIQGCVCAYCGIPLKDGGEECFSCRTEPLRIRVRAAAEFNGCLAAGIHRFKYGGRRSLGRIFAPLLDYAWSQYRELQRCEVLVPVPLHRRRLQDRGYNQADLLARSLAARVNLPVLSQALIRLRHTRPQVDLQKADRERNQIEAFGMGQEGFLIKNKQVLLIDDVCTTGSTLLGCAQALKREDPAGVQALVLARDL